MLVTVGGDQGAHLEEAGLDVRDRRLPQFNMGADSAVPESSLIAVDTLDAYIVREPSSNYIQKQPGGAAAPVVPVYSASVFSSVSVDMP